MRLVQKSLNTQMWNEVTKEHIKGHPGCDGDLYWPDECEEQRGHCWIERAKCTKCSYLSKKFKLYTEVARDGPGRRAAAPNVGLAACLTQTSIGPDTARKLALSMNTPAPSYRTLHDTTCRIAETIIDACESDMEDKRQ